MKKDGHIKFYTKEEWLKLGELTGFHYTDGFESHIRFPKKKKDAPEFDQIVHRFDPQVTAGYDIEMILSILVDTFFSSISLTMRPVPNPHNTACVLS